MKNILIKLPILLTTVTSAFSTEFLFVGSGSPIESYYSTAGSICFIINKNHNNNRLRCSVEATEGSVYNINAIKDNDLNVAIAKLNIVENAYLGKGKFVENGAIEKLRVLFLLNYKDKDKITTSAFVTSKNISEKTAYKIVKNIFDNYDTFIKLNPNLQNLKKDDFINKKIEVPFHKGAIKYYKENGWIN